MRRDLSFVIGAALAFAVACGSDEGGGGSGGSAGSAGSGASGGSAGSAGSAGASGNSGSSGSSGSGGSGGSAGSAGAAGSAGSAGTPNLLSETGLFTDIPNETLAPGVSAYEPAHQLWSDAATKRRWLYLPPGTQIDTSDMDFWVYPVGTKVWKEFTRGGTRVETRLLQKTADPDQWLMLAFEWNDAGTDAVAVPNGVVDAKGTQHDIPNQTSCAQCHDKMKDRLLSVSAIQLSHQKPGVTLDSLIADAKLTNAPSGAFTIPGNDTERAALGYLHANCGTCHNTESFVFSQVNMNLWLSTSALGAVADTPTYLTTVNQALTSSNPTPSTARIVPGKPAESDVHYRMNERGTLTQMPPLASEDVDTTGLAAVDAWINSL